MRRDNESRKHLLGRKGIFRKERNRSDGNLADTDKQLAPGQGQLQPSPRAGAWVGRASSVQTLCGDKAVATGG